MRTVRARLPGLREALPVPVPGAHSPPLHLVSPQNHDCVFAQGLGAPRTHAHLTGAGRCCGLATARGRARRRPQRAPLSPATAGPSSPLGLHLLLPSRTGLPGLPAVRGRAKHTSTPRPLHLRFPPRGRLSRRPLFIQVLNSTSSLFEIRLLWGRPDPASVLSPGLHSRPGPRERAAHTLTRNALPRRPAALQSREGGRSRVGPAPGTVPGTQETLLTQRLLNK